MEADPMRRPFLIAASALAFAGAIVAGPLGAEAAPPYVYGCTPGLALVNTTATEVNGYSIYNGSASSASLTIKLLDANGMILNAVNNRNVPITSTLPATHTTRFDWIDQGGVPGIDAGRLAAVRIVASVPVSAALTHLEVGTSSVMTIVDCNPLVP
jgi:hypothetical protein